MAVRYSIWALLLFLAAPAGAGEQAASPAGEPAVRGYTVFAGGAVAGREDVTMLTSAEGFTISGRGRVAGTLDIIINRVEIRYQPDWQPISYGLEAVVNSGDTDLSTSFSGETAVTKGIDRGQPVEHMDTVPADSVILPGIFFGSYEALTRRLSQVPLQQEFPVFIGAGVQAILRLTSSTAERVQIGTSVFNVRRYGLAVTGPRGVVTVNVYADENGSLLRVSIPSQRVDYMRDDLASATARTVVYSNPTDEAVNIPAAGFNLAATLTWPKGGRPAGNARVPVVVLLSGAAADERDGLVAGVPILGQLAGALADAGYLAVRFDKRGSGQSGGRAESTTLGDHAEDVQAIVRWLADRRDVDRSRIAVLGHNEGAWTALLAANRERRIAAVAAVAAPSAGGADRWLERQRHELDRLSLPPAERVAKIELQQRINEAVITGRGWEALPPEVRSQADTPWFQSFLTFDPVRVIEDVRQPLLLLHGELDAEVPVTHVDRLAEAVRTEGRSRSVSVVTVRGVNHLLVPAQTGDLSEYPTLKDRTISPDVASAITGWLMNTFAVVR
ncbi:MAG: hypothetical protein A3F70_16295 [Acidobacteria bacterium RIFCSPLOWO2_12_FULL_67_14]|nr:MAG: hypothetical protein A3F70_16295 [Acidobacteria bacterium RIFCSPLOWO2_12_FULL_67_14]